MCRLTWCHSSYRGPRVQKVTARTHVGQRSGKTRTFYFLTEIVTMHLDHHAHLLQPRAHAFADAVAEGLLAHRGSDLPVRSWVYAKWSGIRVISGDDSGETVVIARVQNLGHRIPHPFARLGRAEL